METIAKKAEDVYNLIVANQQKVADIFVDFFGESYVDYQKPDFDVLKRYFTENENLKNTSLSAEEILAALGEPTFTRGTILVYFPKVTVTNEHGNSIEITKVFVRTLITTKGGMYTAFDMTRGEYTLAQFRAGYIHSHCSQIPDNGDFSRCCLGTGPIRHTVALLANGFDEDRWNLYCFELSEYLKVESIAGIPYNSMSHVVNNPYSPRIWPLRYSIIENGYNISPRILRFWRNYLLQSKLSLNFCNGNYSLGVPPIVFFKDVTSKYLDFLEKEGIFLAGMMRERTFTTYGLCKGVYVDNTFHDYSRVNRDNSNIIERVEGGFVCNFKGQPIYRHITEVYNEQDCGKDVLLQPSIINLLLTRTLLAINYGTTENNHKISKEFRIL